MAARDPDSDVVDAAERQIPIAEPARRVMPIARSHLPSGLSGVTLDVQALTD